MELLKFFSDIWIEHWKIENSLKPETVKLLLENNIKDFDSSLYEYSKQLDLIFEKWIIGQVYKTLKIAEVYILAWKKDDFKNEVLNIYQYIKNLASENEYYMPCSINTKIFIDNFLK